MNYYQMERLRLRVARNLMMDGFDLVILLKPGTYPPDKVAYASEFKFKEVDERSIYPMAEYEPLRFGRQAAQELLDELWGMGLRPTAREDPNGRVEATERHLKDMRKLVNHVLGTDLGELK